jgi:alkylhydroperoxidase family enzyme
VRRLTGNEHLAIEFATEWPTYDLDQKTRALLGYAAKLTDTPSAIEDADLDALRTAGWDERGIWQATALISFFNFSGRMEAAAGLPLDEVPVNSRFKEAKPDHQETALRRLQGP